MQGSEKLLSALTDLTTEYDDMSATQSKGAPWTYRPWNSQLMKFEELQQQNGIATDLNKKVVLNIAIHKLLPKEHECAHIYTSIEHAKYS